MTITRDIIRVFYHIIMAVCSTVYIHLYWGSQKTESIILGSCPTHEACRQNDKTCTPTIKNCLFAVANLPTHFASTQIIILLFQNKFSFFMAVSLKS